MNRTLLALLIVAWLPGLASAEGLSYRGWGPRVGLSVDPDQVVAGVHIDLGQLVKKLRFQPNLDIGYGDDALFVGAYLGAYWFFDVDGHWDFYAGSDLGMIYEDIDYRDSDLDVAFNAVGGIETRMSNNSRLLIELKVGVIENPDFKLMVGWTF